MVDGALLTRRRLVSIAIIPEADAGGRRWSRSGTHHHQAGPWSEGWW